MSAPLVLETVLGDVAFWVGLVSVLLFAYSRFNISLPGTDELSPPLEPRSFTTAFRFQLAAFTYVGLYVAVYFVLLFAGAFPWLQTVVKQLFGSLDEAGGEGVGTPAWAALVATSILPSTPGFRWIDECWRGALQDFASIPAKAHMLGREILRGLPYPAPADIGEEAALPEILAAIERHKERFLRLRAAAEEISQVEGGRPARRYRLFFAEHKAIADGLEKDFAVDAGDLGTAPSARYVEERFRRSLRKTARFFACAMLNAEPSEYAIRTRLTELGLDVRVIGFDFRPSHLLIALATIVIAALCGCYLSVFAYGWAHGVGPGPIVLDMTPFFFKWIFVAVSTYTLPIVLAAGVEMYLLDRMSAKDPLEGSDYAAIAILTFIGSVGLSLMSLLVYNFVMVKIVAPDPTKAIQLWRILPWALPPAIVSTLFLILAGRKTRFDDRIELAFDAMVHGGAAALAATGALFLSYAAGNRFGGLPEGFVNFLAPISIGVIGAALGAVLCAACRRRIGNLTPIPSVAVTRAPSPA
jgi:hypothetical protein